MRIMVLARTKSVSVTSTTTDSFATSRVPKGLKGSLAPTMVPAMRLQVCVTVMSTLQMIQRMQLCLNEIRGSTWARRVKNHALAIPKIHFLAAIMAFAMPATHLVPAMRTITVRHASTRLWPVLLAIRA